ncbi:sterol-sensing domain [Anaeramoeba flamelloides]|uniref:Sterol-sensing domain n=1 Tax=Anaeramoeba flamelloides TaxID=1746091 RepID=A0AAV7YFB9_9EUKA|nr:sterol-sensing domain [Anaeramoeba flamelloides]
MSKKKKMGQDVDKTGLNRVTVFIMDHPWWMIIISMGIALVMTISCAGFSFQYDSTMGSFVVREGKTANQIEGMQMVFREEGYFDKDSYQYSLEEKAQQSQPVGRVNFYYECVDCDNLFTKEHLQKIYDFENDILNDEQYKDFCYIIEPDTCYPPTTGINFFFDDDGNMVDDIDEAARTLYNDNDGYTRTQVCDKNFEEDTLKVKYLMSTFLFAYPLEGYKNKDDKTEDQDQKYEDWIVDLVPDLTDKANSDNFEILYLGSGITEIAVSDLIVHDTVLIVFSIAMVYIYTLIHTKSLVLTCLGILHVLLSLPMSYFFYVAILGVEWFSMLNFLSLFVVLGIGCDDIFIMLDAWKQSEHQKKGISKNKYTRMHWAYNRAATTMLITTLTSAGAFFGNVASTIPPIRYFGIFTGMAIVFNYLLVITWFPAVIAIWDRNGAGHCCCGDCCKCSKKKKKKKKKGKGDDLDYSDVELEKNKLSKKKKTKGSDDEEDLEDLSSSSETSSTSGSDGSSKSSKRHKKKKTINDQNFDVEGLRNLEKYFYKYHAAWIKKFRWAILIIFAGIIIGFGIQASKLEPSEEPAEFLPDDHFLARAINVGSDEFLSSEVVSTVYIQWGVESIDREGVDPLEVEDLGKVIYNDDWEPNRKTSQEWVIEVCEGLREKYEGTVFRDGQITCFMEDFRDWVTNETLSGGSYTFPVEEDQFQELLGDFTNYAKVNIFPKDVENEVMPLSNYYGKTVSFDKEDDHLLQYNIQFNLVADAMAVAKTMRPIYDDLEEYVSDLNKDAPEGMDMAGNVSWKWMEMLTEEVLITVALTTIFVSLAIAFVIIIISTDNYITSFLAILSIGGVVVTIIGLMVSLGWSLGAVESISLTIIVGISIDYIVHFCHAYNIAQADTSFDKLRIAMTNLGISVVSAAITTLMSAFVMFFTYVIFFKHFGIFIWMTILSSVFWSFIFFFTLLVFIGPIEDAGKVSLLFKKYFCKEKYEEYLKKKDSKDQTNDSKSSSSSQEGIDDNDLKDIEDDKASVITVKKSQKEKKKSKKNSKNNKKKKKNKKVESSEKSETDNSDSDSQTDSSSSTRSNSSDK